MNVGGTSVLLPTAYLPPVSYFYTLMKYDNVFIEQYETYPKQTFRNRCEILSANGKLSLIIPVKKPDGNATKTKDISIFNWERWQLNHWRAIESAYLSSPFFLYFKDDLEKFYSNKQMNLLDLNLQMLSTLMDITGIKKEIRLTQDYDHQPEEILDLRNSLNPKKHLNAKLFPPYQQVFSDRHPFQPNLSILDLLFNLGPDTYDYLATLDLEENLRRR
jgi:hypothetical protein